MIRGLISQEFELESLGMLQWCEREWRAQAGRRAVFLAGEGRDGVYIQPPNGYFDFSRNRKCGTSAERKFHE